MKAFVIGIFCTVLPLAASAATLTVKVENIDKKGGILHVALYDEASWKNDDAKPIVDSEVEAVAPETIVTLSGICAGRLWPEELSRRQSQRKIRSELDRPAVGTLRLFQ